MSKKRSIEMDENYKTQDGKCSPNSDVSAKSLTTLADDYEENTPRNSLASTLERSKLDVTTMNPRLNVNLGSVINMEDDDDDDLLEEDVELFNVQLLQTNGVPESSASSLELKSHKYEGTGVCSRIVTFVRKLGCQCRHKIKENRPI